MKAYRTRQSMLARARRVTIGAALSVTTLTLACSPTDVLVIEDPDIINPGNVQSAAGAQAVRVGAIARFNAATSGFPAGGTESLFLLGGLFSDEWVNGDSFIARQEIDQRVITPQNTFLTSANRVLHRARLSADQAIELLARYDANAPRWQVAEMYFIKAFTMNLMAEHYCDGLIFSTVVDGREQFGSPVTTVAAYEQALTHATDGLALITGTTADDVRVRSALQVMRGRILVNLNRHAEAATAVNGVATSFRYTMRHSTSTHENAFWNFNNNVRRYSVGNNEGANGLNFATANDPRVPVCVGGTAACNAIGVTQDRRDDQSQPLHVQMLWTNREASVAIVTGIEARLIEAEAQFKANGSALTALNAARATVTGLAPLTEPATPAERVNQLFRERAFWLFGTGHRVGDLRRLIRQYSRTENTVFPTGAWHKGGNYGTDVTVPVPADELNNPNASPQLCLARSA